jgi:hypothetical protein
MNHTVRLRMLKLHPEGPGSRFSAQSAGGWNFSLLGAGPYRTSRASDQRAHWNRATLVTPTVRVSPTNVAKGKDEHTKSEI